MSCSSGCCPLATSSRQSRCRRLPPRGLGPRTRRCLPSKTRRTRCALWRKQQLMVVQESLLQDQEKEQASRLAEQHRLASERLRRQLETEAASQAAAAE